MTDATQHPRYEEALRHARNLRGFYTHLLFFTLVTLGLAAINLWSSPGRWWFGWATFGWGLGLVAHGVLVFAFNGWLGSEWEERKVREYLDRRG